jgi:hypothetical protein
LDQDEDQKRQQDRVLDETIPHVASRRQLIVE